MLHIGTDISVEEVDGLTDRLVGVGKYGKSNQGHQLTAKSRWRPRERPRPENYRTLLADTRYLARCVEDLRHARPQDQENIFDSMRAFVQHVQERDMDPEILEESHILGTITAFLGDVEEGRLIIPLEVKENLGYLFSRWSAGALASDPYRGIITEERNGRVRHSIDINYPHRKNGNFFGSGHLVNGLWWPLRICMLRDGAHRHLQAGICGVAQEGAQAVVMGKPEYEEYADVDMGDEIWYVGTAAKEKNNSEAENQGYEGEGEEEANDPRTGVTNATELLFTSIDTQFDVRVFRSSKLPKVNKLRPATGFRYDGCYKVISSELLEPERSVYRFKMIRNEGQSPIQVDEED